jgi:hypothetical protein
MTIRMRAMITTTTIMTTALDLDSSECEVVWVVVSSDDSSVGSLPVLTSDELFELSFTDGVEVNAIRVELLKQLKNSLALNWL